MEENKRHYSVPSMRERGDCQLDTTGSRVTSLGPKTAAEPHFQRFVPHPVDFLIGRTPLFGEIGYYFPSQLRCGYGE